MNRVFTLVIAAALLFLESLIATGAGAGARLFAEEPPILNQTPSVAERVRQVENGLLPSVLVKGRTSEMKLSDRLSFYKIPGVSIAVINNGRIEWARGFGVVEAGGNSPITTETLFQAGSISKPVAAMAALKLVEMGKLDLDQDVNQKLTSWKVPENEFTKDKKVTLRGLVSHNAGLTVHGFPGYAAGAQVPTTVQVLDGVKPPANTSPVRVDMVPGTRWRYSGGGYTVMQQMLADVTNKPFPQLMKELVLGPIGMKHSTYEQPLPASLDAKAAAAHRNGEKIKGRYHTYPEMAAAGLWTTPSDLALWVIEVQNSVAGRSTKVLSTRMAAQMVTRQAGSTGLGPWLEGDGPAALFGHGGVDEGFEAQVMAYVNSGRGAVVMINGNRGIELAGEIIRGIARVYAWPDYLPAEIEVATVDPKILEQYAGHYEFSPGVVLTISMENGRLFGQAPGRGRGEMYPQSTATFIVNVPGRPKATFVRDQNGQITEMVLADGPSEHRCKRIK